MVAQAILSFPISACCHSRIVTSATSPGAVLKSKMLQSGRIPAASRLRASALAVAAPVSAPATVTKPTLIDIPVSNNGAKVRFVLYKKGLESEYDIVAPTAFGGLKSDTYLRINPQGKMPALMRPGGTALYESEVLVQYLLDKYRHVGPSLLADTPEDRAIGNLVARIHDVYIAPIQACMYRKYDSAEQRAKEIGELAKQLDAIEKVMIGGPFVCGSEITAADGSLFPTIVFMDHMLPKYFGWKSLFTGRPKLAAWWEAVQQDPESKKIIDEIRGGLQNWEKAGRWKELGIIDQVAANPHLQWSH